MHARSDACLYVMPKSSLVGRASSQWPYKDPGCPHDGFPGQSANEPSHELVRRLFAGWKTEQGCKGLCACVKGLQWYL